MYLQQRHTETWCVSCGTKVYLQRLTKTRGTRQKGDALQPGKETNRGDKQENKEHGCFSTFVVLFFFLK